MPSISAGAHLKVRPGDAISASVTVRGRSVRLRIADDTRARASGRLSRAD